MELINMLLEQKLVLSCDNMKNTEANWLLLPEDIQSGIANKLILLEDYTRFGAVCRAWRSVYIKDRDYKLREPVYLMVPTKSNHDEHTRSLYSLSEKRVLYDFQVRVPCNRVCFSSSDGWLVTVSDYSNDRGIFEVSLLNPFLSLNNEIQLPPLLCNEEGDDTFSGCEVLKAVLSGNPLTNPNYVVMAIFGRFKLAFFKPGNKTWTFIPLGEETIHDIIWYEDLFCAVDDSGAVFRLDVQNSIPRVETLKPDEYYSFGKKYLVESAGVLMLIIRTMEAKGEPMLYHTTGFIVYKYDQTAVIKWSKVNDLYGQLLFLGDNHSVSVSASDLPGCKPNCIYFTDEMYTIHKDIIGPCNIGVFSSEDGSIEPHYTMETGVTHLSPIWIQPML